jgi:hypothetical protein
MSVTSQSSMDPEFKYTCTSTAGSNKISQWGLENGFSSATKIQCVCCTHISIEYTLPFPPWTKHLSTDWSMCQISGLNFDSKLSWEPCLWQLHLKCERTFNILRFLSGSLWGGNRTVKFFGCDVESGEPPLSLYRDVLLCSYTTRLTAHPHHLSYSAVVHRNACYGYEKHCSFLACGFTLPTMFRKHP